MGGCLEGYGRVGLFGEVGGLIHNQTVRRGPVDPSGTRCAGTHRSWGVSSVAQKVIVVRPRQDGRHFDVFLRAVAHLAASKLPPVSISELHIIDSIWGDQGLELGGYNLGKLDSKTITGEIPALR